MTQQEIIEDFPELNQQQIQSCLAYAAEREHHLLTVNAAQCAVNFEHVGEHY